MFSHSAHELHQAFIRGELSAVTIAEYFLKRVKTFDTKTDAFLHLLDERMLKKAVSLDQKRKQGKPLGKLAGVPIALKDNIHIKGETTTCASRFLEHYRAPFDATVTSLIEKEDGLIIGKTNLDEFAMGSATEYSAFKKTHNPWNLTCTPGGSSGGSAAAVAGRLVPLALGSDTGGSIRQPAAFSGVIGLKPTYGRVSRYGLIAFASSLDQIGPLGYSIEDIALLMEVIGRPCTHDATSLSSNPPHYTESLKKPIQGKTVGVPWSFLQDLPEEGMAHFKTSLETLKQAGVDIVEVDMPSLSYSVPVYYILATAEASTNLARFDGMQYGHRSDHMETIEEIYTHSRGDNFGREVKQRILLGTYVLSSGFQDAYYTKAQKVRSLMVKEFQQAFTGCDVLALPTSGVSAFPTGSVRGSLEMYIQDLYTIASNLTGCPSISIPSGFDKRNMPLGLQLVAPQLEEGRLFSFSKHFLDIHPPSIPPLFATEKIKGEVKGNPSAKGGQL